MVRLINVWFDGIPPPDMAWSMPFSRYAQVVVRSAASGSGMGCCCSLAFSAAMIRNMEDLNIEEGRWRRGMRRRGSRAPRLLTVRMSRSLYAAVAHAFHKSQTNSV